MIKRILFLSVLLTEQVFAALTTVQPEVLKPMTAAQIIQANGSGVPTATTVTGDVTISSSGVTAIGSGVIVEGDIANDAVTDAKLRESAALSVVGNSTNGTANPTDISASSDGNILRRSGTSVGFGAIDLADSDAVGATLLPIANAGTNKALTLSAGGIPYFDADSFEVLSAGTAGQVATSGGASAPTWSYLLQLGRSSNAKIGIAQLNCDGGSTQLSDPDNMVSGIANNVAGVCDITLETGYFSATPMCSFTHASNSATMRDAGRQGTMTSATAVSNGRCREGTTSSSSSLLQDCASVDYVMICIGAP